jgi:hypothetical protein
MNLLQFQLTHMYRPPPLTHTNHQPLWTRMNLLHQLTPMSLLRRRTSHQFLGHLTEFQLLEMALETLVMRGPITMVGDMEMDEAMEGTLDMEDIHTVVGMAMGSGNGSVFQKATTAKIKLSKILYIITKLLTDILSLNVSCCTCNFKLMLITAPMLFLLLMFIIITRLFYLIMANVCLFKQSIRYVRRFNLVSN